MKDIKRKIHNNKKKKKSQRMAEYIEIEKDYIIKGLNENPNTGLKYRINNKIRRRH